MTPLLDTLILIALSIAAIIMTGLEFWFATRRKASGEPIIELEILVHCRACGSMIPEGVRKCAFCGAWQRKQMNP